MTTKKIQLLGLCAGAVLLSLLLLVTPTALAQGTPSIVVQSQSIVNDTITISSVTSDGPGWVIVRGIVRGAELRTIAGYAPVTAGQNLNVVVHIDPLQATAELHVILYHDGGAIGKFEPSGSDTPVYVNGQRVAAAFYVTGEIAVAPTSSPAPTATATAAATATATSLPTGTPARSPTASPTSSPTVIATATPNPAGPETFTTTTSMPSTTPSTVPVTGSRPQPWPFVVVGVGALLLIGGAGLALARRAQ